MCMILILITLSLKLKCRDNSLLSDFTPSLEITVMGTFTALKLPPGSLDCIRKFQIVINNLEQREDLGLCLGAVSHRVMF